MLSAEIVKALLPLFNYRHIITEEQLNEGEVFYEQIVKVNELIDNYTAQIRTDVLYEVNMNAMFREDSGEDNKSSCTKCGEGLCDNDSLIETKSSSQSPQSPQSTDEFADLASKIDFNFDSEIKIGGLKNCGEAKTFNFHFDN